MARPQSLNFARALALCALIALGITACNRDTAPQAAVASNTPEKAIDTPHPLKTDPVIARKVMQGEWRLVAIDEQPLRSGGNPTVVFGDEGNCWGNTGVNDFRTTFTLEGADQSRVKVGPAAVTRKAGPPEAMALETLFLERFESASSFKVDGNHLHLQSGIDQNLTFERILR